MPWITHGFGPVSTHMQTESPPAQALEVPRDSVTHSGHKDSHLAPGAPATCIFSFKWKWFLSIQGRSRLPWGTQGQLGPVSVKVPCGHSFFLLQGKQTLAEPPRKGLRLNGTGNACV